MSNDLVSRLRTAYPAHGEDLPMDISLLMEQAAGRLESIGRFIRLYRAKELSADGTINAIGDELV